MSSPLDTRTQGAGPDVVLVHGALGDRRQWEAIAERLSTRFRVHAVSRRHHWPGAPPSPDTPYTFEGHRDDLLAVLSALDGPAHLVGHSYGAGVALLAALAEPRLVRSLALIETSFGSLIPEATPGLAEERASRAALMDEVRALLASGDERQASRAFVDWLQGGPGGFSRLPSREQEILLANAATLAPMMAARTPDMTLAQVRTLRAPTLVLSGAATRAYYRLIGEALASCLPGSAPTIVPGCAHMTIVENPDGCATELLAFLARAIA